MSRLLILPIVILSMTSAHGQEFTSPNDLLSTLYFNYLSGQPVTNFEPYFSERLTSAMGGGEVPQDSLKQLGFDPISGTVQPELMTVFNLETVDDAKGLTATTTASFRAGGQLVTIKFDLVHEQQHGWQIDHISGTAGGASWCSNDLVAAVRAAAPANEIFTLASVVTSVVVICKPPGKALVIPPASKVLERRMRRVSCLE